MPRNIVIDSTTIISIVAAAFFASGGRNAGTPFDTASTPVIAVQPFEKAVSSRNSVSGDPVESHGAAAITGVTVPVTYAPDADRDQRQDRHDEEVGRHREDPARFANAAEVAEHQHEDEPERHLHPVDVPLRKRRGDRRDAGRDAHGDGEDVVDQAATRPR